LSLTRVNHSMTEIKTRSFWKVASFVLLAALILSPAAIVSADEGEAEGLTEVQEKKFRHPRLGEVTEINTEENTIVVKVIHPKRDDIEDKYVLVNYTDETLIKQDREEASESDIEVGEKIFVRGERTESEEYAKEINADSIHVFDELHPKRFWKHKLKNQKQE